MTAALIIMATAAAPATAQIPRRYIVLQSETCSDRGGWKSKALFQEPGSAGKRRYCAYVWSGNGTPPMAAPMKPGEQVLRDLPVLVPQQAATAGGDASLYREVRRQLELPSKLPAGGAAVKVAVLDSGASPEGMVGSLRGERTYHAFGVSRLIEVAACGERSAADCPVKVENTQVLNLDTDGNLALVPGHRFGERGRLAEAIVSASNGSPTRRLVINLSVGWSACWEPSAGTYSPEAEMVRSALVTAVCRGAIVVAAAGNRDAVPGCPAGALRTSSSDAHMLPGLWGGRITPSDAQCLDVEGSVPAGRRGALISVGAIQESGRALGITDRGTNLVAYGARVSVPDGAGRFTPALTGTSMSAAAASGMLAALWRYQPDATPASIIYRLVSSAADWSAAWPRGPFTCGGPTCARKQLKLCRALSDVPALDCDIPRGAATPSEPPPPAVVGGDARLCAPDECGYMEGQDTLEVPYMVGPQPGGDGCSVCALALAAPAGPGSGQAARMSARNAALPHALCELTRAAKIAEPEGRQALRSRLYADEIGARIRLEFSPAWRPRVREVRMVIPGDDLKTAVLWTGASGSMPEAVSIKLPEELRAPAYCYLAYRIDGNPGLAWHISECPAR